MNGVALAAGAILEFAVESATEVTYSGSTPAYVLADSVIETTDANQRLWDVGIPGENGTAGVAEFFTTSSVAVVGIVVSMGALEFVASS